MVKKRIAVLSGSRADFSHLKGILSAIKATSELELHLLLTGSHLSKQHGYTIDEVVAEGFDVHTKLDLGLTGDTPADICRYMSSLQNQISTYFSKNNPDLLLVLGDRYELLPAANSAVIFQIPIVHIHGGEATEGLIDDAVRHSLTKMASVHFVATDSYRHRVIQMGENPSLVFNFGAPGLDNLKRLQLKSKAELSRELGIGFNDINVLVTYHPVTLSLEETKKELNELLEALNSLDSRANIFITLPNADTYNSWVKEQLEKFIQKHPSSTKGFSNLGYVNYLSMMKAATIVMGNSSSGIIEAPFLRKAVVNVGIRQKGRVTSPHIVSVPADVPSIKAALEKVLTQEFQDQIKNIPGAYGDGDSCARIVDTLKSLDLSKLKYKHFHDIDFNL